MADGQTRESIAQQIEQIKQQQAVLQRKLKQAEFQARAKAKEDRNKRIFKLGLVVESAGHLAIDFGVLRGLLEHSKELLQDEQTAKQLQRIGEPLLPKGLRHSNELKPEK